MNQLDDGQVVFFCGAGISMGTGLPSFGGLVGYIYEASHLTPDNAEGEALDLREPLPERRHPKIDKALGLLEREHRLGSKDPLQPSRLRKIVIDRLSVPSKRPLKVHRAIIDLSRTAGGIRLVTTNFDNRFKSAGVPERLIYVCPSLPVPKPNDWHSLVHLHGRIGSHYDWRNLVLTAADFGRAYLTEQWASRFVVELFREFTVVFVGYSLDDPVMSYMVDALAAERSRGARFGRAFAFAGHDATTNAEQHIIDGWKAKSVEPIPYHQANGHKHLNDTLIEWARIRKDPFVARTQIVLGEIAKFPDGVDDPIAKRVTWALQDPVAIRELVDAPRITEERDFPKVIAWLDVFDKAGLLSRSASPSGSDGSIPAPLVDGAGLAGNPPGLDSITGGLAIWVARHLHVPQVLEWIVRKGGFVHPELKRRLRAELAQSGRNITSRLRFLWTLMIDREPPDFTKVLWLSDQYALAASGEERITIARQAVEAVSPYLKVLPGPSSTMTLRRAFKGTSAPIPAEIACAHLELSIGEPDLRLGVEALLGREEILATHAEMLTAYLERAIDLLALTDDGGQASFLYRRSIAPDRQNEFCDDWTKLIDWARDSYLALAKNDRGRASRLLERWAASKRVVFRRLALHAITENEKADISLAADLLLKGHKSGLWDTELRRIHPIEAALPG